VVRDVRRRGKKEAWRTTTGKRASRRWGGFARLGSHPGGERKSVSKERSDEGCWKGGSNWGRGRKERWTRTRLSFAPGKKS